jgi:hypothetical protein
LDLLLDPAWRRARPRSHRLSRAVNDVVPNNAVRSFSASGPCPFRVAGHSLHRRIINEVWGSRSTLRRGWKPHLKPREAVMKAARSLFGVLAITLGLAAQVEAATTDPEVIIYRFPGVLDNGTGINVGVATIFQCTNFSGEQENIRLVTRSSGGFSRATLLSPSRTLRPSPSPPIPFGSTSPSRWTLAILPRERLRSRRPRQTSFARR